LSDAVATLKQPSPSAEALGVYKAHEPPARPPATRASRGLTALLALSALGLLPVWPQVALAELKTSGKGKDQRLVTDDFPADQKARNTLFEARCGKCHELSRPISAVLTGRSPLSDSVFDGDLLKGYVLKMMRKANSGIEKDDARELIVFLLYARTRAVEK
jgi:hypothetical protein